MFFEDVFGELSSLCVGVVSSNGVKDIDVVLDELLGSDLKRGFVFFAKAASDAVLHVGELRDGRGTRCVSWRVCLSCRWVLLRSAWKPRGMTCYDVDSYLDS
jgi:hypothetical protein